MEVLIGVLMCIVLGLTVTVFMLMNTNFRLKEDNRMLIKCTFGDRDRLIEYYHDLKNEEERIEAENFAITAWETAWEQQQGE